VRIDRAESLGDRLVRFPPQFSDIPITKPKDPAMQYDLCPGCVLQTIVYKPDSWLQWVTGRKIKKMLASDMVL
jgi:hypothetical protein